MDFALPRTVFYAPATLVGTKDYNTKNGANLAQVYPEVKARFIK